MVSLEVLGRYFYSLYSIRIGEDECIKVLQKDMSGPEASLSVAQHLLCTQKVRGSIPGISCKRISGNK